jgi:hypothetical protein
VLAHQHPEDPEEPDLDFEESESEQAQADPFNCVDVDQPLYDNVDGSITMGEVLLVMFDWVAANKVTNKSTEDMWLVLAAIVPPGVNPGKFAVAERILRAHLKDAVVLVPVCRNDCVAFYNFKSEKLKHLQYAELDRCPDCKEERYVIDGKGKIKNSKVPNQTPLYIVRI